MDSLVNSRTALGLTLSSILVFVGYEIQEAAKLQTIELRIGLIIVSILLSGSLTSLLVTLALSFKIGRMLLMRGAWIEGYWAIKTHATEDAKSSVTTPGLM